MANAVEVILNAPKKTNAEAIKYVNKKDYGKVPKYLKKVQQDIQMETEILQEYLTEMEAKNPEYDGEALPEQDREELIKALKRKWGHVNRKYQNIVGTHSSGKIKLKEKYESELTAIETDIKLLSRGPVKVLE